MARHGVRVEVLTFTHGEAGSCGDPPLCTPDKLSAVRECELRSACAALGIQPPRLLDYADGHLHEADLELMISQILSIVNETKPQVFENIPQASSVICEACGIILYRLTLSPAPTLEATANT